MLVKREKNKLQEGCNQICSAKGPEPCMLMDVDVFQLKKGEKLTWVDSVQETAVLLICGEVTFSWENESVKVQRENCFDFAPYALHVCSNVNIQIEVLEDSEILRQKTPNDQSFASILYTPEKCVKNIFGEEGLNGTAYRIVRDIFDYSTANYSNMVLGEVITFPGKWSSYPPHHHEQPEVYYYKFDKPQGFGFSLIGDSSYKIENHSASLIPGNVVHPQVAAPGYAMYYTWMIRHLPDNPWADRIDDPQHEWTRDPNAKIWEE